MNSISELQVLHSRSIPRRASTPGGQDLDEWVIPHRSISRRMIIAIIAVAAVLILGSLVVLFPSTFLSEFGPAPVWHSFGGVFYNTDELASEDCSLGNLQPIWVEPVQRG